MIWHVPKIWEGGDVWILGGGPSVAKQFGIPEKVIQEVFSGASPPSVYSPYMEQLHGKHVIGINAAYLIGDWLDMVFFGDSGFFLQHKYALAKYPGLKVCSHPHVNKRETNWVKFTPRDTTKGRGLSDNPSTVCWNGNSGSAALSIAANAGASRIILLGFDMSLNSQSQQHWHNVYGRGAITNPKSLRKLPFDRHKRGFVEIAKDAKRRGIEILNASPESTIEQFSKYTVKELL